MLAEQRGRSCKARRGGLDDSARGHKLKEFRRGRPENYAKSIPVTRPKIIEVFCVASHSDRLRSFLGTTSRTRLHLLPWHIFFLVCALVQETRKLLKFVLFLTRG